MTLKPLLVLLAACSGGGGSSGSLAAGTYFGDVVVMHTDQSKSVFANAEIVIDDDGQLDGTLVTETPTTNVGDPGTIRGTVVPADGYMIDIDVTFEFDRSGSYAASGATTFAAGQRSISSLLVTRESGAVIGRTSIVWQPE